MKQFLLRVWNARTRIVGWLTAVTSAAYIGLPVLQAVVSARTLAISTFSLGTLTAAIGHFNRAQQKELEALREAQAAFRDAREPLVRAAEDHEGDDNSV